MSLGVANVDLSGSLARMSGTEIMEADVSELIKKRSRLNREVRPALGLSGSKPSSANANASVTVRFNILLLNKSSSMSNGKNIDSFSVIVNVLVNKT